MDISVDADAKTITVVFPPFDTELHWDPTVQQNGVAWRAGASLLFAGAAVLVALRAQQQKVV